jgi:3-hydroxybutyryl-CoA dehydratase
MSETTTRADQVRLFSVQVGDAISVAKTVSESDVYLFAGLTGDLHPNHINEEYMRGGRFGQRVVHGALLVGLMSTASTRFLESRSLDGVSYGYDRIRFIAPVFFGDTVTVDYRISRVDAGESKSWAEIKVTKQDGKIVAVAEHILKYLR